MAQRKPNINWGDDISDVLKMINRALQKNNTSKKAAQVDRVSKRISKQMKQQGKPTQAKTVRDTAKRAMKSAQTRKDDAAKAQSQARKAEIIKKETRYQNKIDVEKARGKGAYTSTTGKQKFVGAERAAEARRRAGAMESQAAKRYATMKKREDALNAALKKAKADKDASKARKVRMELRKLRGEI